MNKTIWTGDYTGDLEIGTRTQLTYAMISCGFPKRIDTGESGVMDAPTNQFTIDYQDLPGTLHVFVDGIEYPTDGTYTSFTISGPSSGIVHASYIPFDQSIRMNSINLAKFTKMTSPFKTAHITTLVTAIHRIQLFLNMPPTRFNISENELNVASYELLNGSQVISALFADMDIALSAIYARLFGINSYTETMASYDTFQAGIISAFRLKITYIEGALGWS